MLPIGARADFLRVLTSSAWVRADVIRQIYARDDTRDLAEVLMDLGPMTSCELGWTQGDDPQAAC